MSKKIAILGVVGVLLLISIYHVNLLLHYDPDATPPPLKSVVLSAPDHLEATLFLDTMGDSIGGPHLIYLKREFEGQILPGPDCIMVKGESPIETVSIERFDPNENPNLLGRSTIYAVGLGKHILPVTLYFTVDDCIKKGDEVQLFLSHQISREMGWGFTHRIRPYWLAVICLASFTAALILVFWSRKYLRLGDS